MKSLVKFFASVRLAITLLIIIIIASILGTLIPQQRSPEEYLARYGQLGNLFTRLQLTKLYHSSWYITLLFLFALNIIVCTLNRFSPKIQKAFRPNLESEAKNILALKLKENFKKNSSLSLTKEEMKKELASHHYRFKEEKRGNKILILARKRILGIFGADAVHLGLLIILCGGIISGIAGFRHNLVFSEGEEVSIPHAEFKLRLDKFETEYYPDRSVKDWKSTLTVIENNKPLLTKSIEVNHPLSHRGLVFYQSSYGWNWENPKFEIWVKKKSDASFLKKLELRIGEKVGIGDGETQISLLHFVPDFIINEKKEITTRSSEPNNPAVFIDGWEKNEKIFSGWIFAKFPDFARIHSSKETDLSFELKSFQESQYSVIQVARDPGASLIWLGSALLMVGFFLVFYWPTREIRVILEESQGKTEVCAGGISSKSREAFQSEFEKILTSLRRGK